MRKLTAPDLENKKTMVEFSDLPFFFFALFFTPAFLVFTPLFFDPVFS